MKLSSREAVILHEEDPNNFSPGPVKGVHGISLAFSYRPRSLESASALFKFTGPGIDNMATYLE